MQVPSWVPSTFSCYLSLWVAPVYTVAENTTHTSGAQRISYQQYRANICSVVLFACSVMAQQLVMLEGRVGLANAATILRQFSACGISTPSSTAQSLDNSSTLETNDQQSLGTVSLPQNQDQGICNSLSSTASCSQQHTRSSSIMCSTTPSLLHPMSVSSMHHLSSPHHSHAYCSAAVGSASAVQGAKAQQKVDVKSTDSAAGTQPASFVPGSHQDPSRNVNMRERR